MRLIFLLFFAASLIAKPLDLEVSAKSAILMNADTGKVLFEKHAHVPCYPGSTTKIATALYVLERGIDLKRVVTVSADCLKGRPLTNRDHLPPYWLDSDGTMMGLKRGEALSLETLLYGCMLVSGNDAANVIAESVGGNVPGFVGMLNEYLKGLGCKNTQFANPHGLPHPTHLSTAYDLALITKKALTLPHFRKVVSTLCYTRPKTNKQPAGELKLTNPLLKPNSRYYYPKAIGVKTGHTTLGQDTLVAAAQHEGRTLIAVVLGCAKKTGTRYEDVKRLFEAAFTQEKEKRRVLGPENIFTKEILGSKKPLKAALAKPLVIDYFPAEEPECKAALSWSAMELPIHKGQKVGEISIRDEEGRLLKQGDMVALEEIKGSLFYMLKKKILRMGR